MHNTHGWWAYNKRVAFLYYLLAKSALIAAEAAMSFDFSAQSPNNNFAVVK